jgi:hypothetical protein
MARNLNALLISLFGISAAAGTMSAQVRDSSFAALQARGKTAMGVDQYTSTHKFDALEDGGRIELQRDTDDSAGVVQIRQHLREITLAFQSGDFSTPAFVHMQVVPGASVMAAKRDRITYTFSELPRGAEVRIVTTDPEALKAIHCFMAFQRQDHRAEGTDHGAAQHPEGMQHPKNHGGKQRGGEMQPMNHGAMQPGQDAQHPSHHGAMQCGQGTPHLEGGGHPEG